VWFLSERLSWKRERRELEELVHEARLDTSDSDLSYRLAKGDLAVCRDDLAKALGSLKMMRRDLEQYKEAALDYERLAGERAEEVRELKDQLEQARRVLG
jgi:hypothetical protein